ncbi:MAG TPA: ABC transporter ATP-binding protein [Chitinophagaceae bacterium]|nr:ABC transporter ATP-binding protein [Chitinophagaceae bacterium]
MQIQLSDAGKKFNREWIFRGVDFIFQPGKTYAITGPNGSGKSTLLQAIAGSLNLTTGKITWQQKSTEVADDKVYHYLSLAAPYLELIEEMTAREFLQFHASFKPLISTVTTDTILQLIGLEKAADKQIRYYSSGMKQRVKLAQAIFSDVPLLLLDEPCTNLDISGYDLYHRLIKDYCSSKTIIVSSNDQMEIDFCEERIQITDYK